MSCAALTAAVAITDPLTLHESRVLLTLANYADEDGRCWPSQDRLALESHVSRRTVQAVLPQLRRYGYLATAEPRRGRCVTVYQLNLPALVAAAERCRPATTAALRQIQRVRRYGAGGAPQPAPVMAQRAAGYGAGAAPDPLDPKILRKEPAQTPAAAAPEPVNTHPARYGAPAPHATAPARAPGRRAGDGTGPVLERPTGPAAAARGYRRRAARPYRGRPTREASTWDAIADAMTVHFDDGRERVRFQDAAIVAESSQQLVVATPWARRLVDVYGAATLQAAAAAVRPGLALVLQELDAAALRVAS